VVPENWRLRPVFAGDAPPVDSKKFVDQGEHSGWSTDMRGCVCELSTGIDRANQLANEIESVVPDQPTKEGVCLSSSK